MSDDTQTIEPSEAALDETHEMTDDLSLPGEASSIRGSDDIPLPTDDADADGDTDDQPDDAIPGDTEGNALLIALAKQQLGYSDEQIAELSGMTGLEAMLLSTQVQQQADPQAADTQTGSQPSTFTLPWEQEGQSLENSDWDEDTAGVFTSMRDHYDRQQNETLGILHAVLTHLTSQQTQASESADSKALDVVAERAGIKEIANPAVKKAILDRYHDLAPVLSQQGLTGEDAMEFVVALSAKGLNGIRNDARQEAIGDVKQKLAARKAAGSLNPDRRGKPPVDRRQAALDKLNRLRPQGNRQ